MRVAIINGVNLNLMGQRQPDLYGQLTYKQLVRQLQDYGKDRGWRLSFFQSNSESKIIDFIQTSPKHYRGLLINAGAYTHTSIAIADALAGCGLPCVEVHITDLSQRELFRQVSYLRTSCIACFMGEGIISYQKALDALAKEILP